ncbi:hypothetical protein FCULG_00012565 [Fusarium culmorum]|uniref:Chromo domain-containing protein n=1 Tax=Fusarium culmorum TaxID=5516 RepID=A0A2T4GGD6_FUSCU|nr:hypothetical protein FCULG_00012848 [Fusarium culmorum]PTD02555.1 hypothetical protein FCULG_00012565 [Fusarium culmorum]
MAVLTFQYAVSLTVATAWSSDILITEVLLTFRAYHRTFYGVKTVNRDCGSWVWPAGDSDGLLWVFEEGGQLKVWQEHRQAPYVPLGRPAYEIEHVIGYYQSEADSSYVGVKWKDYESPTWELEEDIDRVLGWDLRHTVGPGSPAWNTNFLA